MRMKGVRREKMDKSRIPLYRLAEQYFIICPTEGETALSLNLRQSSTIFDCVFANPTEPDIEGIGAYFYFGRRHMFDSRYPVYYIAAENRDADEGPLRHRG